MRGSTFEIVVSARSDLMPPARLESIQPPVGRAVPEVSNWTRACECLDLERWQAESPRKAA